MKTIKNKLTYVCSPYRGEVRRNKEYARELTRLALDTGFIPVTVHLYLTEAVDDNNPEEREKGMAAGAEILKRCKYILIGSKYGISEGMAAELKLAQEMGIIPIYATELEKKKEKGEEMQDWDTMTEAEKFKEVFARVVKREGAGNLLAWLTETGFFEAPAGAKHHGAYPGGLVVHSNNVYRRLVMMAAREEKSGKAQHYTEETLAIVALLHDVCKIDVYELEEKDGKQCYTYNEHTPLGHGEKSIYFIMRQGMTLTDDEAMAIRWHMGAFDKAAQSDFRDLDRAFKKCPLAVMLHLADMEATHFDEWEG